MGVLATGRVRAVTDPEELAALELLDAKPWAEGSRPRSLRITVRKISGHRLVAASGGAGATETPWALLLAGAPRIPKGTFGTVNATLLRRMLIEIAVTRHDGQEQ